MQAFARVDCWSMSIMGILRHFDLASSREQNPPSSQHVLTRNSSIVRAIFAHRRTKKAVMVFHSRIHEEHWLRDKFEEGRIVVLEDESIWEMHPSDRRLTRRWLRISTITVKDTQKEGYLLSNTTEGEEARANYLGAATPTFSAQDTSEMPGLCRAFRDRRDRLSVASECFEECHANSALQP